jgi:hypothetical protein
VVERGKGISAANLDAVVPLGVASERTACEEVDAAGHNRALVAASHKVPGQLKMASATGMLVVDKVLMNDQQMHRGKPANHRPAW